MQVRVTLCLFALFLGCALASSTYYVSGFGLPSGTGTLNDPFETVTQAINAAINGDTIILLPGVYSGSANRPVITKPLNFVGQAGAKATTISCQGAGVGWEISTNGFVNITGIGFSFCTSGVETYSSGANVTLDACRFVSSTQGVYFFDTQQYVYIHNSTFLQNVHGIYSYQYFDNTLFVEKSFFYENNNAISFSNGDVKARASKFASTSPNSAVSLFGSTFYSDSNIYVNNSADNGGGVYVDDQSIYNDQFSTFVNNNAQYGGAIYIESGSSANLQQVKIELNSASAGGDVYCEPNSNLYTFQCTIKNNTGAPGGCKFS